MGKSSSSRKLKKAAGKPKAKAAANGRASVAKKGKVVKPQAKKAAQPPARPRKQPARASASTIVLPEGYRPLESEQFMNERHRLYFRNKLVAWKEEIVRQNRETLHVLHEDSAQHADIADRATSETDRALELRARDRQRKLINKIDAALARIEEGTYGFCEETGEPIGIRRLEARPIATLSLEAQERHERRERVFRED
jgi:DnaK suppressor protein